MPRISVIIPTLNSARTIIACLEHLARQECIPFEIILVDGGSRDHTLALAQDFASANRDLTIALLNGGGGRGGQMHFGSEQARGDILLFLHSDILLRCDALAGLKQAQRSNPDMLGGALGCNIPGTGWWLALIHRVNWIRASWFKLYFGDQSLFVVRDIAMAENMIPAMPLMEDLELSLRIAARGNSLFLDQGNRELGYNVSKPLARSCLVVKLMAVFLVRRIFNRHLDTAGLYSSYYKDRDD